MQFPHPLRTLALSCPSKNLVLIRMLMGIARLGGDVCSKNAAIKTTSFLAMARNGLYSPFLDVCGPACVGCRYPLLADDNPPANASRKHISCSGKPENVRGEYMIKLSELHRLRAQLAVLFRELGGLTQMCPNAGATYIHKRI